jgi:CBS domain-containing protein
VAGGEGTRLAPEPGMQAKTLMTSPAITCHVNDPLHLAAQLMWDHDCGALAVVNDDRKLVAMITDRDICMAALTRGQRLDELLVNGAMSKHVFAVGPEQSIADVEQLMAAEQIRRVPVVDIDDRPIGMLSLNDLALAHGQTHVAATLRGVCRHRRPAQHAA